MKTFLPVAAAVAFFLSSAGCACCGTCKDGKCDKCGTPECKCPHACAKCGKTPCACPK